jgi:5'-methylthioadenosine phosphorylase
MNEIYYKEGLHDLIEKTLIDAISRLSAARTCNCGSALDGGFHGDPPAWLKRRAS